MSIQPTGRAGWYRPNQPGDGIGDDGPAFRDDDDRCTAPPPAETTIPVVVALPDDTGPRAAPVAATVDFEDVAVQSTFDLLALQVVGAVEQRYRGDAERRTESAAGATGTTGTVLVRRIGFADDSVAGYEYTVEVEQGAQGWFVASATKEAICYRGGSGDLCI